MRLTRCNGSWERFRCLSDPKSSGIGGRGRSKIGDQNLKVITSEVERRKEDVERCIGFGKIYAHPIGVGGCRSRCESEGARALVHVDLYLL